MKIGKFDKYYHPMISAATHSASAHESNHMEPAQSVCVADCYFIVNVLDLPFASPIAICR